MIIFYTKVTKISQSVDSTSNNIMTSAYVLTILIKIPNHYTLQDY